MSKLIFITLLSILSISGIALAGKNHKNGETLPVKTPDEIWQESITEFTVSFELSEESFNSDTVLQADCYVNFDRFDIEGNSYNIVFKAGNKAIANYETRNEFLNITDFRANMDNLRETKHQILNLSPANTPEGAVSILLKPASADQFSCEVEVMQNKKIPVRIPYIHRSNAVQTSTKPEAVVVALTVPEADLVNCNVVFQETPEAFNVCYYDFTLGENKGCFGTGLTTRDGATYNAQFNVNGYPGPGACQVTYQNRVYRSNERFIRQ